jgi:hypothetical protein
MPEYKKQAIEQLREIRRTGEFNMFSGFGQVMEYASEQKMCSLASYVQGKPEKYIELLGLI